MPKRQPNTRSLVQNLERLVHEGRFFEAIRIGRELIAITPENEHAQVLLATAEIGAGHAHEARARLEKVVGKLPSSARLWRTLASALRLEGRSDKALAAFEHALELDPDDPVTRCALGEIQLLRGSATRAIEILRPIIDNNAWDANSAIVHAMICENLARELEAIEPVEQVLAEPHLPQPARIELLYRLGSLRDRLGDHDNAFAAFDQANRSQRVIHDPDATRAAIEQAIESWTRDALEQLPRAKTISEKPVLIVGMPRSGTSLVEQILSSHPQVFGGDERGFLSQLSMELDPPGAGQMAIVRSPSRVRGQAVNRSAQRYLRMLEGLADGEQRITDKMPINLLHLGLVSRLAPGARVIHCRRDPLDTCLSCYFQNFSPRLSFAFDLEHCGRFLRLGERLMEHWQSVTDLPILEVSYEDVVEDQEGMARRMIEFVGLEWDDNCLQFHKNSRLQMTSSHQQVRRPIYRTSLARHEHYAEHLDPLRRGLDIR